MVSWYVHGYILLQKLLLWKIFHTVKVRSGSDPSPVVAALNLPIRGTVAISAPAKVFMLGPDRFKKTYPIQESVDPGSPMRVRRAQLPRLLFPTSAEYRKFAFKIQAHWH